MGLVIRLMQNFFQAPYCLNRAIHVGRNTGNEDPVTKLSQSTAERAQAHVAGKEPRYQQHPASGTACVRKCSMKEPIEGERYELAEPARFAKQIREAYAWVRFHLAVRPQSRHRE